MFLRKISLLFVVLFLTVSCSTTKTGLSSDSDPSQNELASNVPNYVLFDIDSARLESDSRSSLDKQVEWLEANPDINIVIEGHCDERGTREYNLALGAKRANSAKSYLIAAGINRSRIATISYGKERPVIQGAGASVWKENRRAITSIN